ncbi:MAG: hypothetical protein ACYC6C_02680 [Coriobacteriia bacterium]
MPAAWRLHVITRRLQAEGIVATVAQRDLYSLEGAARHAVLDALIAHGGEPPLVLVGDEVACCDGIDLDAVIEAVRRGAETQ